MREILLILIVMLAPLRQVQYSKAPYSDRGIYDYFSKILERVKVCLRYVFEESNKSLNVSSEILKDVRCVEKELPFYVARGIKTNLTYVLPPFLRLSIALNNLTHAQIDFLRSKNCTRACSYLGVMMGSLKEIRDSVKEIGRLRLWGERGTLRFKVRGVEREISKVFELLKYYRRYVQRIKGLRVAISNPRPYIYQNVTIYVYSSGVKDVHLLIDGRSFAVSGWRFPYSFKSLGLHTVYATGRMNGRIVRSNVLRVMVVRIPTRIVISAPSSAYVGERVRVGIMLIDVYGRRVRGCVRVKVGGKSYEIPGYGSVTVSRSTEGYVTLTATFSGSKVYSGCKATARVFFARYPSYIRIWVNRSVLKVNESLRLYGTTNVKGNLTLYINSKPVKSVYTKGNFTLLLKFTRPGVYKVFMRYPGDPVHGPATSNDVTLKVLGYMPPPYQLYALIAASILAVAYGVSRVGRRRERVEERPRVEERRVEVKIPRAVDEAYSVLYDILVSRYGLKRSLTPRELLNALSGKPFFEKLKFVTEVHERVVYGLMEVGEDVKERYFNFILEIIKEVVG